MFEKDRARNKGFTLIEALIAFVVLSVGLLGALMFHSTLINESGTNKIRLEALKIAEQAIEQRRGLIFPNASSLAASMSTAASSTVAGTNENFLVTWGSVGAVSGSSDAFSQDVTVSWNGGADSVVLSTIFSWISSTVIDADEADTGEGGEYDDDRVPLPTGTLSALAREKITVVDIDDESIVKDLSGGNNELVIYNDGGADNKIAIEICDTNGCNYVQLAELSKSYNEIITISGEIKNLEGSNRMQESFGYVYEIDGNYLYDIIDIRSSAGSNCIITDFSNDGDGYADYAKYVCVAGTGWNGNIYPYLRTSKSNPQIKDWDLTLLTSGNLVCSPRQRNYRYYTLELKDESINAEDFVDSYISLIGVSTATALRSAASAAVVGQSGLVRFYTDDDTRDLLSPNEGVVWGDYFWQNPHYIVSPGWSSVDSTQAYALLDTSSNAMDGYKIPSFVSSAENSYSVNYPGDVAYQNYIIGKEGGTINDCDTAIAAIPGKTDPLNNWFMADFGMPGYISSTASTSYADWYGYVPSGALAPPPNNNYAPSDYNAYDWEYILKVTGKKVTTDTELVEAYRGSIVLGYALATETLKGVLTIDDAILDTYSISDFTVVGNPEPTASINCAVDSEGVAYSYSGTDFTKYSFTCPVPINWSGRILAHVNSEPLSGAKACTNFASSAYPSYNQAIGKDPVSDDFYSEVGAYVLEQFFKEVSTAYSSGAQDVFPRLGFSIVESSVDLETSVFNLYFSPSVCEDIEVAP